MELKELYYENSIDKQLVISYDDKEINNTDVESESMELEECLCSEKRLTFGSCEASVFKIRVRNHVTPMKGKRITVSEYLDGDRSNFFTFGIYIVDSDKPEANRTYRDIIAYDDMWRIINTDVSRWYNGLVFPLKLKAFRSSFLSYFGIVQEDVTLANDDLMVYKTIEPSELSGKTVITAICEINGCFGHIGRDGRFQYILLPAITETLYPRNDLYPKDNLYPSFSQSEKYSRHKYIKCRYEDFKTPRIDKLQIRQEENDIGAIAGTGNNAYIVEDNFLCYGLSAQILSGVANNLFSVIREVSPYHPFSCTAIGNPCINVGEHVSIYEQRTFIEAYVLRRVLKGIQSLKDTLEADGSEIYGENINSLHKSILQLKGKTNVLTRTVEETKSEIRDVEAGLTSSITQTADKIETEVTRATSAESLLSSRITQTANSISLKVSKGEVSSQLSIESGQVKISSNRFVLDSTNCKISADGTITATNGNFSGTITSNNAIITGGRINMYASSSDSGIMLVYGSDFTSIIGTGITVRNTYGSSTISGNSITSGGSLYVKDYLYTNNIRSNTGSTITFGDKAYFSQDTEFNIGKTHTMKGTINIDGEVKIGGSASYVGFFGQRGSNRKSISKLYSSSETINMNKINEIIDALKAYNLIG